MELLIPAWFFLPWLVFMALVIRVSIYEMRLGFFRDLPLLPFSELKRRIGQRRKLDPNYDRMKCAAWRWLGITIVWWVTSFLMLLGGAFIYGSLRA